MMTGTNQRSWMHFLPSSKLALSKSNQRKKNDRFETIFSASNDKGKLIDMLIFYLHSIGVYREDEKRYIYLSIEMKFQPKYYNK